jgi:hypothetical protein
MIRIVTIFALLLAQAVQAQRSLPGRVLHSPAPIYELRRGVWFDGQAFAPRTMWTVSGRLTDRRPARVDSVLDLAGGFVVPPFAESHTHNIGCPPTTTEWIPYLRAGIMYVWKMSGTFPPRDSQGVDVVEVACASPPLTGRGSHIVLLDERSAAQGNFPGIGPSQLDGRTHILVDSREELERKLPGVLDTDPTMVKVILAFSEEFEQRRNDPTFLGKRGMDPRLLSEVVRASHARGIRVAAHIDTAADFRAALNASVDIVAHLPGLRIGESAGYPPDAPIDRFLLTAADAEQARRQGTLVETTVMASRALRTVGDPAQAATRAIFTHNAKLLLQSGVHLIVGSDLYAGTVVDEALTLGRQALVPGVEPLAILENAELLLVWTIDTPKAMFPGRRIGSLQSGSEANLLVLAGNPVADLSNVRRIMRRMKEGYLVDDLIP